MKTLNIDEKIRYYSNNDIIKKELVKSGEIVSYVFVTKEGSRFIINEWSDENGEIHIERTEIR